MSSLALLCQLTLVGVFGLAAFGKLSDRQAYGEYSRSIQDLQLVTGQRAGDAIAVALVAAELLTVGLLVTGLLLAIGWLSLTGLLLGVLLLSTLTAGVRRAVREHRRVRCRCFGGTRSQLGVEHLIRNGGLLLLAVAGLIAKAAAANTDAIEASEMGLTGLGAVLITAIIHSFDDLVTLLVPFGSRSFDKRRGH